MQDNIQAAPLTETFGFLSERPSLDWPAYNCPEDRLLELLQALRDQHGYSLLLDVTAVDWGEFASPRFTGVYHLYNLDRHVYLRIAVDCASDDEPALPSVVTLFPGANWHERETFDMFGIRYRGHPDLRRILMWDSYPYFPLRKEFPLAGIETAFPSEEIADETGVKVKPAPMMGGPFHAGQGAPMSETEPRAKDESWTERRAKSGGTRDLSN